MSKYKNLKESYKHLEEWFKIKDEDANFFQSIALKRDKTIYELNRILDKAHFDKTEFVYVNKTAHNDKVSYNLTIEVIDPILRTYNISKIPIFPTNIDINQEQPIVNVISTKSNKTYILIKVEILVKQSRSERILLHNKQNHTTRFINPQELKLYKE